ncbi:MAG: ABC transporter permease [Nanoarchaeota archaeon]|jgi:putative ABC transport system permease protein|nr:ABC transporter permease [Nanoarchaeota archaeon]
MKAKKSFQLAWNILVNSKLRSWLTIVGIVIGIAAVIAILSISQGAQASLESQLGGLGGDIVTVTPGMSKAGGFGMGHGRFQDPGVSANAGADEQKNLTNKDIIVLRSISNVRYVMGQVSASVNIVFEGDSIDQTITGVDTEIWKDITTEELTEGRFLTKADAYSVVIGERLADETFEGIPLNRKIEIEGKSFKVVGILADSSSVFMPIDQARIVLEDVGDKEFDSISIKLDNAEDDMLFDDTLEAITKKLKLARGILNEKDRDFTVTDMKSMQETMSDTMNTMALFLGAIAAISLLVGAIGIANTMFTSVLEKTREIGIMKAIGAKNKDVLSIFLLNSGMIGLVGGIGGAILGIAASSLIGNMMGGGTGPGMLSSTLISPNLILIMLGFSIVIGMIAGAIPAYNASRMKPVDALRYE